MCSRPTAIIIGAGLGGIATAAHLARNGYQVTVFEKNGAPGGRCGQLRARRAPLRYRGYSLPHAGGVRPDLRRSRRANGGPPRPAPHRPYLQGHFQDGNRSLSRAT